MSNPKILGIGMNHLLIIWLYTCHTKKLTITTETVEQSELL